MNLFIALKIRGQDCDELVTSPPDGTILPVSLGIACSVLHAKEWYHVVGEFASVEYARRSYLRLSRPVI